MLASPPAGPAKPGTLWGNTTNPFLSCATAVDHARRRVSARASQLSSRLIVAFDKYERPNTPDTIADLPQKFTQLASEIVLELTPSHPLREGVFFSFSSSVLVQVAPGAGAAPFGLTHFDSKIIAGLDRVIDPTACS
jgi:hypothetical protein